MSSSSVTIITLAVLLFAVAYGQNEMCNISGIATFNTTFDGNVKDLVFASSDFQDVYVKTDGNLVYRSTDGGNHFEPIMEYMSNFYEAYGRHSYGVDAIIPGAADGLVYFLGANRKIYWSTHGDGVYTDHETDYYYLSLQPHPTNPDILLREQVVCDEFCSTQLEVSESVGTDTWSTIRQYVYSYSWIGEGNELLFVSVPEDKMTGNYPTVDIEDRRLYRTQDFGQTIDFTSQPGLYDFYYSSGDGALYAAKYDNTTTRSILYTSPDEGQTYLQAQFRGMNSAYLQGALFLVLPNTQEISFVAVCEEESVSVGNLFQANLNDALFWLDRPHLRLTCDPTHYRGADFQEIYSLPGTFFSNGYAPQAFAGNVEIDDYIQSAFSFNKGGTWTRLTPPEGECEVEECYLHVFSEADGNVQEIYSREDAVGLVIATGNVGEYRKPLDESNTYISRNGGFTWELLKQGRFQYSISKGGNLIILLSESETNEIFYSWDQGITWNSCIFSVDPLSIRHIIDISLNNHIQYLLVGKASGGAIISLSFDGVSPDQCQGFENPGTEESDYEIFTAEAGGACLLGQQLRFTRRKQSSACLNFMEETKTVEGNCECTRSDYTCDGDCWKEAIDENGNLICANNCVGLPNDPTAPPENCIDTYSYPSGYRKVEGDTCVGGLVMDNVIVAPCDSVIESASPSPVNSPNPSPSSTPSVNSTATMGNTDSGVGAATIIGGLFFAAIVLLVVLVLVLLVLYKVNPKFRRMVNTYLPASMGGGSGDTKLYSVLGDTDEVNSLFADDDMFLDDANTTGPISSDNTPLGSLLDFDDDDADEAIDIQL